MNNTINIKKTLEDGSDIIISENENLTTRPGYTEYWKEVFEIVAKDKLSPLEVKFRAAPCLSFLDCITFRWFKKATEVLHFKFADKDSRILEEFDALAIFAEEEIINDFIKTNNRYSIADSSLLDEKDWRSTILVDVYNIKSIRFVKR